MIISRNWLQDYFDSDLPSVQEIAEVLTMHAFEVESVGDDSVLDVKVLPDRSHDSLSHRGIAIELAAALPDAKLKEGVVILKDISIPESNVLAMKIEETEICKRISAVVVEHVEVKESPVWLQERLKSIGQRSINNIVDATNFVMFSCGQPLHAYDRDLLMSDGGDYKIIVRKAQEGESIVALDDKEYFLTEDVAVIADGNSGKALGIAGIKGGKASEITTHTKHIILEAANFDAVAIRKTAKKLGLRTDASVRFENEITPELTLSALELVKNLILKIAHTDETQVEGMVDVYTRKPNKFKVGISESEVEAILGVAVPKEEIENILIRRNFQFEYLSPFDQIETIALKNLGVPYKLGASVVYDAGRFFDCSSFTAYVYSQVGISIPRISVDQFVFGKEVSKDDAKPGDLVFSNSEEGKVHTESVEWMKGTVVPVGVDHVGVYIGNDEVIHATRKTGEVTKEKLSESLSFKKIVGFRRVSNEESRFVVTVPVERIDIRAKEDLADDIGKVYGYANLSSKKITDVPTPVEIEKKTYYANKLRDAFVEAGYSEVITYVFQKTGEVELQNPLAKDRAFLRANLSEGLMESHTLNSRNKDLLGLTEIKLFEIGNVFTKNGEHTAVACIGGKKEIIEEKISEVLSETISFQQTGTAFETNFDSVVAKLPIPETPLPSIKSSNVRYKTFSVFPCIVRDIAVFVPTHEQENIIEIVTKEAGDLLVTYRLFDTFTKEFPEGKKTSYAYRLVFQSMDRTLTDEEINPIMEQVTSILNGNADWQVR